MQVPIVMPLIFVLTTDECWDYLKVRNKQHFKCLDIRAIKITAMGHINYVFDKSAIVPWNSVALKTVESIFGPNIWNLSLLQNINTSVLESIANLDFKPIVVRLEATEVKQVLKASGCISCVRKTLINSSLVEDIETKIKKHNRALPFLSCLFPE